MKIAVAGATGTVGRHVVARAEAAGHDTVALARENGIDLTTGAGLTERLRGVGAVVDCLGIDSLKTKAAIDFFGTTTTNLLEAEHAAGVGHHVVLSIVGIDGADSGYYAGKVHQERTALESDQAVTILRSTQFFEFAEHMLTRGKMGPLILTPRMTCAPVAVIEVAQALVDLGTEPATSDTTMEICGPETQQMVALTRSLARKRGISAPVVGVPMPGANGKAMRDGSLLSKSPWRVGRQTFSQWLDQQE